MNAESGPKPVSIIVPTYNERDNLPELFARLKAALAAAELPFELLVVDDDSPDGTAQAAEALGPEARAIVRRGARGLATAVILGIRGARYDRFVCMDADLSHPPEMVPALVAALDQAGMSIGSRYVSGGETVDWSWLRWLNSAVATALARPLTAASDPMSGFFAADRQTIPLDALDPVGYKIALEILVKSRLSLIELPITFTDRRRGDSKMTARQQHEYLVHLLRLYRWRWPLLVELASFCLVGALGMCVDLLALTLLIEIFEQPFEIARVGGFLAAVSQNFLLNDTFTFVSPKEIPVWGRYGRFLLSSAAGMLANYAVSLALFYGFPPLARLYWLPAVAGVLAGTAINFLGARTFAFRRAERP